MGPMVLGWAGLALAGGSKVDGDRPAWVAKEPGRAVQACAASPITDVERLDPDPDYVQGYASGGTDAGARAPWSGGSGAHDLTHHQGVQRLQSADGATWFVVSDSVCGAPAGLEVVRAPFGDGQRLPLGPTADACAWEEEPTSWIEAWSTPDGDMDHAGGLQALGELLFVALEREDDDRVAGFRIVDLADPAKPGWGPLHPRRMVPLQDLGAVAAFAASDGRTVALLFGYNSQNIEVQVSDEQPLRPDSTFTTTTVTDVPEGFEWYQNVQAIPSCDGEVYLLGTHQFDDGEDWADLWRLRFTGTDFTGPVLTKAASAHLTCRSEATGGARACDFDAGAGIFVDQDHRLVLYAVTHDEVSPWWMPSRVTVGLREFAPRN